MPQKFVHGITYSLLKAPRCIILNKYILLNKTFLAGTKRLFIEGWVYLIWSWFFMLSIQKDNPGIGRLEYGSYVKVWEGKLHFDWVRFDKDNWEFIVWALLVRLRAITIYFYPLNDLVYTSLTINLSPGVRAHCKKPSQKNKRCQ